MPLRLPIIYYKKEYEFGHKLQKMGAKSFAAALAADRVDKQVKSTSQTLVCTCSLSHDSIFTSRLSLHASILTLKSSLKTSALD